MAEKKQPNRRRKIVPTARSNPGVLRGMDEVCGTGVRKRSEGVARAEFPDGEGGSLSATCVSCAPDGSDTRLARKAKDGEFQHRPGRDLTFSAAKSVSVAAIDADDGRIVEAHDRAVKATLASLDRSAAETRVQHAAAGRSVRVGGHPGEHRDVAVVPEPGLDVGGDIRGVVDLDLLGADHRPAPLRLDSPHPRNRARVAVPHSVAVRHLATERVRWAQ